MDLSSGDLLLFEGRSKISRFFTFFTGRFSHVAVVWKCPWTLRLYVWENGSVTHDEAPLISLVNSEANSAHLIPLSTKLKHYEGTIYVRRLISKHQSQKFDIEFTNFVIKHIGRSYRSDFVAWWNKRAGISLLPVEFLDVTPADAKTKNNRFVGWVCSELVAYTYEHLKIVTITRPHHVSPKDLSEIGTCKHLIVSNDFAFTELEHIITNKKH